MKKLVLFDFDGTLTTKDTLFEFAKFSIGKGRCLWATLLTLPTIMLWKLGFKTNSQAKESLFGKLYKDMDSEYLFDKATDFISAIDTMLKPDVVKKMQEHIDAGDEVVIVSASMRFWIAPWANREGVSRVIATEPEIRNGKITGRFATPNCHGVEKERRIREVYPDLTVFYITAYGDSSGDNEMLALADSPNRV